MTSARRLSAIMFTDMVGSTAAAQANEAGALRLRDEQAGLVRSLFPEHQGREIKSLGDGFLAEFDSALRAVECAIDIQQHLRERNSRPGVVPIHLRIGIHLGDVEQRETDIIGDAVNIAARIEPVADPGGICVSGAVREQVSNKIPNKLERLAPQALKGVKTTIDIYRVIMPSAARNAPTKDTGPSGIAVLPFTNISPDPKDEYFADGLTEELITVLSHLRELRVISRTSVMQYKGTPKSVSEIGTDLGVTSVLEGSVRKSGSRLRVTAQLIDAASDRHLWAETYDRELDDVFAVQTDIAKQVAEALKVELLTAGSANLEARPTVHFDSYLAYLKGRTLFNATWSEENFRGAKESFERALSLDPNNARAHSGLADVTRYTHYSNFAGSDPDWERTSRAHAARAVEIDPDHAEGHCTLGSILWDNFEYERAEKEMQLALSLNPSYSQAHRWYAGILLDQARTEEALREITFAEQLDPQSTNSVSWHILILIMLRRLDEAQSEFARLRDLDPEGTPYLEVLSYYHYARGEFEKQSRAIDRLQQVDPTKGFTERIWQFAGTGEIENARRLIERQEAGASAVTKSSIAAAYALIGDLDTSFRLLEEAIAEHNLALQVIRNEPTLEPLRRDLRFTAVLKKMNLA